MATTKKTTTTTTTPTKKPRSFPKMDLGSGTWKLLLVVSTFYSSVHLALKSSKQAVGGGFLPSTDKNQYHPLLIIPFKGWYGEGKPQTAPGLKFHTAPEHAWMHSLVSPAFAVGLPMLYVFCVMLGSRLMANNYCGSSKKSFLKKYIQPIYNVLQIAVCAWMVWGLWPEDILRNPFSLNTKRTKNVEYFVFIHYLTKYLDWCDTTFMILGKSFRQVSFLQVFHHATIGMVWGLVLDSGWGSGTVAWGAFINSGKRKDHHFHFHFILYIIFNKIYQPDPLSLSLSIFTLCPTLNSICSVTHVLLYTHYFVTSLGLKNPLKKALFGFQQAQFLSCIVHAVLVFGGDVLGTEHIYPRHLSWLQVLYHPVMLFLFLTQLYWVPNWLVGETATLSMMPSNESRSVSSGGADEKKTEAKKLK